MVLLDFGTTLGPPFNHNSWKIFSLASSRIPSGGAMAPPDPPPFLNQGNKTNKMENWKPPPFFSFPFLLFYPFLFLFISFFLTFSLSLKPWTLMAVSLSCSTEPWTLMSVSFSFSTKPRTLMNKGQPQEREKVFFISY